MKARRGNAKFSVEDLRRVVGEGKRRPFYLLHGDEGFECETTGKWLIENLRPCTAADFNVDVFHGDNFVLEDFAKVYQSFPMMAEYRLVILKACDKLAQGVAKELAGLLDPPADTALLVVVGGKVDMRRVLFKLLAQEGCALEFRVPYDNQLPQWIRNYAASQGLGVEPEAVDLLHLYIGGNLRELASELEKLALYVGRGEKINRRAVEEVVGISRSTSIFELTDSIGQRNHGRSLDLMHKILEEGEEPTRAVAMITRHLQLLLKAQQLMRATVPREQMAEKMGVAPYFLKGYLEQAQNYATRRLWSGLAAVLDADVQLKSRGRKQERSIMDILLYRLCAPGGPPRVDRMS